MLDAGIRPRRHRNLGGDIPFFVALLVATGVALGAAGALIVMRARR